MPLDDPVEGHAREPLGKHLGRLVVELTAMPLADRPREVDDVIRGVAVLGHGKTGLAAELEVADRDAAAEDLELCPGVVDVVLTLHGRAVEREHIGQHVADRTTAGVRHCHRSGRVRRDELDLDLPARQCLAASEPLTGTRDDLDLSGKPPMVETHVDEAGWSDFDRGDRAAERDALGDRLRDLERWPLQRTGEPHGDVRRVIAVRLVRRSLDLHGGRARRSAPAERVGRGLEPVGDGRLDEIACGAGHRSESAPRTAAASPRGSCVRKKTSRSVAATAYAATSVTRFAV